LMLDIKSCKYAKSNTFYKVEIYGYPVPMFLAMITIIT